MNDKLLEGLLYECGAIPIAAVCEKVLRFPVTKLCKVGTITPVPVIARPKKPKNWFTAQEAAEELGVHRNTIYRLIKSRRLKATNVATKGEKLSYRIYLKDLDAYRSRDILGFVG